MHIIEFLISSVGNSKSSVTVDAINGGIHLALSAGPQAAWALSCCQLSGNSITAAAASCPSTWFDVCQVLGPIGSTWFDVGLIFVPHSAAIFHRAELAGKTESRTSYPRSLGEWPFYSTHPSCSTSTSYGEMEPIQVYCRDVQSL